MDGVGTPIIGRPRPLPRHDTPNPAYHPHTLNYEEPVFRGGLFRCVEPNRVLEGHSEKTRESKPLVVGEGPETKFRIVNVNAVNCCRVWYRCE